MMVFFGNASHVNDKLQASLERGELSETVIISTAKYGFTFFPNLYASVLRLNIVLLG